MKIALDHHCCSYVFKKPEFSLQEEAVVLLSKMRSNRLAWLIADRPHARYECCWDHRLASWVVHGENRQNDCVSGKAATERNDGLSWESDQL